MFLPPPRSQEFFYNRGLQAAAAQLGPSVFTSFSHYAFVFPGRMNATYNLECRDPTTVFVPSIPGVTFFNMGYPVGEGLGERTKKAYSNNKREW